MQDINSRDPNGFTSIQLAAKNEHWKELQALLPFVLDVNETDSEGFSILHRVAIGLKDTILSNTIPHDEKKYADEHSAGRIISFLLEKGAQIDLPCASGDTALHLAAKNGNWYTVEKLLNRAANVNLPDSERFLLIHRLAKARMNTDLEERILRILLSKDVNVNVPDPEGICALQSAAKIGKWTTVSRLIEFGAHVERCYQNGNTAFHWLAETGMYVTKDELTLIVNQLLKNHVDLNRRNADGNTALHIAYKHYSCWSLLKVFLDQGADASLCDKSGKSFLHVLCSDRYCKPEMLETLNLCIANGTDINHVTYDGKTALQLAVASNTWAAVGCLVFLGARYTLSERESQLVLQNLEYFPMDYSNAGNLDHFIKCVLSFDSARQGNNLEKTHNRKHVSIDKALWNCVSNGLWDVANALIRFCDINVHYEHLGQPLIHSMIKAYKHEKHDRWLSFLDLLLSHGLDINSRCKEGRTALQMIVQEPHTFLNIVKIDSLVPVLIEKGADPLIRDHNGFTLLRALVGNQAVYGRDVNYIFNALIEAGATIHESLSLRASDCRGVQSPLQMTSPTEFLLKSNNANTIPFLRKLIESGASSNSELWRLLQYFETELLRKDEKDSKDVRILQILRSAACFPRSLLSLCRLVVSHAVSYGSHRKSRIQSLNLPSHLQDYVLFSDVLSPEFLAQERELC